MTNEITNEEIQRLKALANNCTPGPWESRHHRVIDADGTDVCFVESTRGKYEFERNNRDFIAAANPAMILALIARIESLAADAERLDFLVNQSAVVEEIGGTRYRLYFTEDEAWQQELYPCPRQAIDAAIAKEKA